MLKIAEEGDELRRRCESLSQVALDKDPSAQRDWNNLASALLQRVTSYVVAIDEIRLLEAESEIILEQAHSDRTLEYLRN